MDSQGEARGFTLTFSVAEVCGTLAVILTVSWVGHFRNGFTWETNKGLPFNWHPVLMMIGMIYIYGNSAMIYRVFRNERKRKLKLLHALLNLFCLLLALVGLKAVFDSHDLAVPPIPNLYSLHSWIGLIALLLFSTQWLLGFVCFLFPGVSGGLRARLMPWHQFIGSAVLVFSTAAALMGLLEKAIFTLKPTNNLPSYSSLPPEGYLINFIGLLTAAFCCLIVYLLNNGNYRRQPVPEDEMLMRDTVID